MKKSSLSVATALCVVIFMSGCAETKDGRLAQGQGTALGAAGGALLGLGIGSLVGNPGRGAALGAAMGAAGGFAYGSHVANKKASYAREEDWLDACIASAQQHNTEVIAYNRQLRSQIASLRQQVNAAQVAGDTRKLRTLRSQIVNLSNNANKQIARSNKEVELQRSAAEQASSSQSTRVSTIRQTTNRINGNVNQTKSQVEQLASLERQIQL